MNNSFQRHLLSACLALYWCHHVHMNNKEMPLTPMEPRGGAGIAVKSPSIPAAQQVGMGVGSIQTHLRLPQRFWWQDSGPRCCENPYCKQQAVKYPSCAPWPLGKVLRQGSKGTQPSWLCVSLLPLHACPQCHSESVSTTESLLRVFIILKRQDRGALN